MVSVVLAAYKGEKYIAAQIESIISQLGENDELIISDDYPLGKTRDAVSDLIENDERIVYIEGPQKGVMNMRFQRHGAIIFSLPIRMTFGLTEK